MTIGPPANGFAVTPVVDYEPPRHEVRDDVPHCRPSPHATLRGLTRPPRRPYPEPARVPQVARLTSAPMREAAAFADAALRRVLEVIDRRRPAAQLRPMLAPGLVESVLSIGRSAGGRDGAAVLRRMRLQPAGRRDTETAAEVSGSYSRGSRIHAIACRVERPADGAEGRWQVVALHIG